MCATRLLYPCPSLSPLPFLSGGSPTLVLFPRSLSFTSSGKPCAQCGGGERGVFADWTAAPPEDWHDAGRWVPTNQEPPHLPKVHNQLADFPSLHLHC